MKTKRRSWFKVCPEKWIFGSTREEMTPAERGVWMDFLALAAINDPPGQIDFITYRRLANQLHIAPKLLKQTIEKAISFNKIELLEQAIGAEKCKERLKIESINKNSDSKSLSLETKRSEFGLPLRTINILKWNEYQSEYLRQKPYRQKTYEKEADNEDEKDPDKKLQNLVPRVVTQVTDRGKERRREEIRRDEKITNENETKSYSKDSNPQSPLPSVSDSFGEKEITIKEQFLSMLKNYKGYPYDGVKDSLLFDITVQECPNINIISQTKKKINWWQEHPEALKANPREKLSQWFRAEQEFRKRGGPQKIGNIMEGIRDSDHRNFIKQFFKDKLLKR